MQGFPIGLTSVLTGVTPSQLRLWRSKDILVPEINPKQPPLWSLRDIVALRSIAALRSKVSFQKVRKAFDNLDLLNLQEHPSAYTFGTDGKTVFVQAPDEDSAINLTKKASVGERTVLPFSEVLGSFHNFKGTQISALNDPSPHIKIDFGRLGGWPTVEHSRIGYDVIADLVDGSSITVEDVDYYYPGISADAAQGAIDFAKVVKAAA